MEQTLKLNYKRTFLIGLAFMSICAFWQLYDTVVPLILKYTFHIDDGPAGIVMSADNVIALVLLPILGALSDRTSTKIGKRMPFILFGTAIAVVSMMLLPIIDNTYAKSAAPSLVVAFILALLVLLLSMALYRSPAVSLMSDLTEKPLRSKANAIINLMGALGGATFLLLSKIMYSEAKTKDAAHIDYMPIFIIIAAFMAVSVLILFFTVNEKRDSRRVKEYEKAHPEEELTVKDGNKRKLPKDVRRSLLFLLFSVALWFMGYNAITTAFSKYATQEWEMPLGDASLCMLVATAGAMVSYVPIGLIASKIGRKKTILIGAATLASSFAIAGVYSIFVHKFNPALYILFLVIGFAWAAINVNSLPMVVEMCSGADIGRFTGFYYTFSMAAQVVTPILSGYLLDFVGYGTLFPYGAIFVAASFVTMLFVKHGDSRPEKKEAVLEAMAGGDD